MGLWYPKDSSFELTAFSDADHAGCIDTRKSTSGGIQFLGDKLVSWMSKKQNCTAMSFSRASTWRYLQVVLKKCGLGHSFARLCFNDYKIPLSCDSSRHSKSYNPYNIHRTKPLPYSVSFQKEQVVRLGINPMIQPEPEDLPKDNPKLEIAVLSDAMHNPSQPFGFLSTSWRYTRYLLTSHSEIVDIE
ncbi:hypothetical protein Tco_0817512 [Tanacetum coccineum]